ncbi:BRI1 kinase inhibitor 1 [Salvia miltiorrhiza]|uniref:BRI1 kinase inhibitor 1 n=1 Tax=Salvia miltiorrhiza TaxID=226208 RepID=UPI0025ACC33B|nr:BRI1 kinase inhibitor 1 [Salvia miltiorrhiza]
MEAQHQMLRINEADVQPTKHQVQLAGAASPPPSASSSPSHEFSFTISLHPPKSESNNKSCPPPFAAGAIDLSPADEIFFHGHLLPLHLLSHLPASPRSSTNSLDSFTLPIKELLSVDENNSNNDEDDGNNGGESRHVSEGKGRGKSKSFSLFAMPKWRKEREEEEDHEHSTSAQKQRKSRFELLKRYVRFVKPFLSLRGRGQGSSGDFLRQQPYSYSGNLRVREKKSAMRGRRGEFSAPASMRTSPANSGLLVASGATTPTAAGKSDSTMEELQAAIQAAIAHCKKSIAAEDKIKLHP